jgi:hypothetical protein
VGQGIVELTTRRDLSTDEAALDQLVERLADSIASKRHGD